MTASPDFEAMARKLARDAFDDKVDVHQHAKYIGDALRAAYARGAADERERIGQLVNGDTYRVIDGQLMRIVPGAPPQLVHGDDIRARGEVKP